MRKKTKTMILTHYEPSVALPKSFCDLFHKLDNETRGHSIRCAKYLLELGFLEQDQIDAALLHDLGKQCIPIRILTKKGGLSPNEWDIVKKHPEQGRDLIARLPIPEGLKQSAMDMAMYHHERYNGSGYPLGLKGASIPYCARAMAIVDTFDAMTSKRCYQKKVSRMEALNFIRKQSGILYDPELVAIIQPKELITLN